MQTSPQLKQLCVKRNKLIPGNEFTGVGSVSQFCWTDGIVPEVELRCGCPLCSGAQSVIRLVTVIPAD
ncbi:unnamed protein product [Arctogadus glacialis]